MLSRKQGKCKVIFNFVWVRVESPETVPAASINWVILTKRNRQGREKHNHCWRRHIIKHSSEDKIRSNFERERGGACLPPHTGLVLSLLLSLQKPISKKQRPNHNKLTITAPCPLSLSLPACTNFLRHLLICAILLLLCLNTSFEACHKEEDNNLALQQY